MRGNLTIEASPVQIDGREVKQLCGKEIVLVKVVWGGPAGGSMTWEHEGKMRELYLTLLSSSDFLG